MGREVGLSLKDIHLMILGHLYIVSKCINLASVGLGWGRWTKTAEFTAHRCLKAQ